MEKFKFRVWNEENQFVYFDVLSHFNDKIPHYPLGGRKEHLEVADCVFKKDRIENIDQCTGLRDKNGKLIYVGDIIEFKEFVQTISEKKNGVWSHKQQIVKYDPVSRIIIKCEKWLEFYCDPIGEGYFEDLWRDFYRISRGEIIGNIYENKELLGKQKEEK